MISTDRDTADSIVDYGFAEEDLSTPSAVASEPRVDSSQPVANASPAEMGASENGRVVTNDLTVRVQLGANEYPTPAEYAMLEPSGRRCIFGADPRFDRAVI